MMRRSCFLAPAVLLLFSGVSRADVYPRYCLQRLWLDYPGCADVYECLVYRYDCLYEVPDEELWYGCPTEGNELPEDCDYSCESGASDDGVLRLKLQAIPVALRKTNGKIKPPSNRESKTRPVPGHGLSLSSSDAFAYIETGLKQAKKKEPEVRWGNPEFHRIPRAKIPSALKIKDDLILMAVPIVPDKTKRCLAQTVIRLCVQIDNANEKELTPAVVETAHEGLGKQLSMTYTVRGEKRKGLIWLK
jgi:hypothetical protein